MNYAVIGSGVGGLAIAIRLANKGHGVRVYEKNSSPGGKLSEIREGGYRFDTGPSLFTLPELVEELFTESGVAIENYLQYAQLPIACKYFYPDSTVINFYQDKEKLKQELVQKTREDPENLEKHLAKAREAYQIGAGVFIFNSLHKLSNYLTDTYKDVVFKLHKLDFFRTMHKANAKRFKDPRVVQLFDRYATYNGSNPYKAPATLNMIAHLENNIGAYFPDTGMYAIISSLYALAIKKGVKFHFDTPVEEIVISEKKASALQVGGQRLAFDGIISDADIRYVSGKLIKKGLSKRIHKQEPSSSALIFYWGIRKEFPELELHNILFSNQYKQEFDSIFKRKEISADPTVYLFISSKQVKTDAPGGCENWFVMINVPSDSGQDWPKLIVSTREAIIQKINTSLQTDIRSYIEFEKMASPLTIQQNTLSTGGALYGNSSNSVFSAFLRHPNFLRRIKNLYFVGGSVHPGGGIPLCLASAKIVDQEIPLA